MTEMLVTRFGLIPVDANRETRAAATTSAVAEPEKIAAALEVIPNADVHWDDWNAIGMAAWRGTGGSAVGLEAFEAWSAKSRKHSDGAAAARWEHYATSPPTIITAASIFWRADQADRGWRRRLQGAASSYKAMNGAMVWLKPTRNGPVAVALSNFTANIVEDVKIDDGSGYSQRRFVIDGSLGLAHVPVERFDAMGWVTREWGADASVSPGPYHEKHLGLAIKALSTERVKRTVYAHLGWRKVNGELVYLHAGGAIGANGPVGRVEVDRDQR